MVPHDAVVGADIALHALVGYALVLWFTDWRPIYGGLGGLVPNADLLFEPFDLRSPFVHRGVMHTPFFLVGAVAVLVLLGVTRDAVSSFGVGLLSELFTDTFEGPRGVMWGYPLVHTRFSLSPPVRESLWVPVALVCVSLLVLVYWVREANRSAISR